MRCPLALISTEFAQRAIGLYADWQKGLTPQGRGLRAETACYRATMHALSALDDEAQGWRMREERRRSEKSAGRGRHGG